MQTAGGLTARLATFAGTLRSHGIAVHLGDEIDAAAALERIDLLDRAEVERALRIALKVPHAAWSQFAALFDQCWAGAPWAARAPPELPRDHRGARLGVDWRWDGTRVQLVLPASETPSGETPGYTPEALLRRKSFDAIAPHEVAAMERLLARLAMRLATRRSRRLVPTRARGTIDLRRSFRAALATDGEFIRLARRTRSLDEPRVVFLYDTSGSMDPHTRFHLAFAFALRRVIGRVEIFAFNTALTRVTTAVAPLKMARSLADLAAAVPDWSGGTRIGACLAEFMTTYADALVRSDTTVVIVSDGLDRGDPAVLGDALSALHARARSIFWLNPLLGDARYQPLAEGMAAALPHVDYFGPAHNVEALEKFVRCLH